MTDDVLRKLVLLSALLLATSSIEALVVHIKLVLLHACQARSQSTEVQLARVTAELSELRSQQAQLESRNAFLENITTLNAPLQVQAS